MHNKDFEIDHVASEVIDRWKAVELDGQNPPQLQTPGSSGNPTVGVLSISADEVGDTVGLIVFGFARGIAGATIAEGEFLTANADGDLVPAGAGDRVVARALEDAASGDALEIFVNPDAQDQA